MGIRQKVLNNLNMFPQLTVETLESLLKYIPFRSLYRAND